HAEPLAAHAAVGTERASDPQDTRSPARVRILGIELRDDSGWRSNDADLTVVRILEPAPAANVIDEDTIEVRPALEHVADEVFQGLALVEAETAAAFVGIGADNRDAM